MRPRFQAARPALTAVLAVALACAACAVKTGGFADAQTAYREARLAESERLLKRVLRDEPDHADARLLLGYVHLRSGRLDQAEAAFRSLAERRANAPDLHQGLALVARERGRLDEARRHAERAVELDPERADLTALLDAFPASPDEPLTPFVRPEAPRVPYVAERGYLRRADGTPLPVRGVNLGVALPGRFPAEFPDDQEIYAGWLDAIGAMHANVVRVYTIHPPVFYRALREHNLAHPERPLLLIHGVWVEPPAGDEYGGSFEEAFLEEARRVVDLVHGQARIPPRPGHASGTYAADVSPWLLAFLIGREWEPWSVRAFDARPDAARHHDGRYLAAADVTPMEAWLARVMDRISAHHAEVYNQQTPIGFTSWPTLDPLRHPTESDWDEEVVFRRAEGEDIGENRGMAFNEDEVSVDPARIRAGADFRAGTFAAYHAYPYYPDFLVLDPGYASHPRSSYAAYLAELRAHHGDQPVLIAEFGVPSSRGRAHEAPGGRHHGGLGEREQARIDVELYREIVGEGLAGGIVFAWMDEWFKVNWRYAPFARPRERNPSWHNLMDPEQNLGLLAAVSPERLPLRGPGPFWDELPALASAGGLTLAAHADAEYLHLLVRGTVSPPLTIEIDTLPAAGPEFRAELARYQGRLLINEAYAFFIEYQTGRPWAFHDLNPEASPRPGAPMVPWVTQINRRRFGRDGTVYPRVLARPGELREGRDPPGARDSMADYQVTERGIHLRLPWTLLGVTDPGRRSILDGRAEGGLRTVAAVGIRVEALGPKDAVTDLTARFGWEGWERPEYELRLKPVYHALREHWAGSGEGPGKP